MYTTSSTIFPEFGFGFIKHCLKSVWAFRCCLCSWNTTFKMRLTSCSSLIQMKPFWYFQTGTETASLEKLPPTFNTSTVIIFKDFLTQSVLRLYLVHSWSFSQNCSIYSTLDLFFSFKKWVFMYAHNFINLNVCTQNNRVYRHVQWCMRKQLGFYNTVTAPEQSNYLKWHTPYHIEGI